MISLLPPPESSEGILEWIHRLYFWLTNLHLDQMLCASATWNPGLILVNTLEAKEVTVTGAALGDYAMASFGSDVLDLALDAQVTAADIVTCNLLNNTGGSVNLPSATIYVMVIKKSH